MDKNLIRGLGVAAVGAGVGVVLAQRRAAAYDAHFYDESQRPDTARQYGSVRLAMPFHFRHSHAFASIHEASYEALREMLPSHELRPLRLPDGRALVYILAARHFDMTDGSEQPTALLYPAGGEVTVAAVVTRGQVNRWRALAALAGVSTSGVELFALHMAVTHRQGRDAGRLGWGMPKFVADLDFEDDPVVQRVRAADGDAHVLTLTVRPGGRLTTMRQIMAQYDVLDGHLVRTEMASHGYMQARPGGAELDLGVDHPVAADLRRLDVSPRATASAYAPTLRVIARAPAIVGDARPYQGYAGSDREYGRFTVRYPGTARIDQYAELREHIEKPTLAGPDPVSAAGGTVT